VTVSQTTGGTTVDLTNDLPNDPIQFVPPSVTATPPRYDLDGNLLSDGRWTYTWDGENRLVKMVSIAWTQPSGGYLANATFPAITLEFAYDGLSRRVQKKTITSGTPTMEGYLYDGWNVLMISNLDPANGAHLARKWSCVWRPDVGSRLYARGSWQAAGGVGGLAWLQTGLAQTATMYTYQSVSGNAEVHIPMMDHMGNVRHYYQIKTTGSAGPSPATVTGQVTANLDYDAFGREVRATGTKTPASGQPPGLAPGDPWVDNLPFHFSTKFTDRESGLNYYGYRFYDAVDGRWLNRDPIAERGGSNLYLAISNASLMAIDTLGLDTYCIVYSDQEAFFSKWAEYLKYLLQCGRPTELKNPTSDPTPCDTVCCIKTSVNMNEVLKELTKRHGPLKYFGSIGHGRCSKAWWTNGDLQNAVGDPQAPSTSKNTHLDPEDLFDGVPFASNFTIELYHCHSAEPGVSTRSVVDVLAEYLSGKGIAGKVSGVTGGGVSNGLPGLRGCPRVDGNQSAGIPQTVPVKP
jgi:RHS repeat-associated protein